LEALCLLQQLHQHAILQFHLTLFKQFTKQQAVIVVKAMALQLLNQWNWRLMSQFFIHILMLI